MSIIVLHKIEMSITLRVTIMHSVTQSEKADEGKQESKAADAVVVKPLTPPPRAPPAPPNIANASSDPKPPQPLLVHLVNGSDLKPFEVQTLAIASESLAISRRTYWIAIFGFLAALAAACFVGIQVEEMTNQTQILASQSEGANAGALMDEMNTRKQLDIAKRQAKSSEDAIATSLQIERADQRAWLGISEFEVEQYAPDEPQKPFKIVLRLRNSGKTPAINIRLATAFQNYPDPVVDGPSTNDIKVLLHSLKESKSAFVAAPNSTRKYIIDDRVNKNIVTANYSTIRTYHSWAYFFGQIEYDDVFQHGRITKFCLYLADPPNKQLAHCNKFNEMH